MPNTLAHLGVQALGTRFAARDVDPKLVYLGCLIPDIPWIIQRVIRWAITDIDGIFLRAYVDVQASMFGIALLAGTFATLSARHWRVFSVLVGNGLLHLLLDATQIKWGNGVHLLAPFSWELTSFNLYWPESTITYVLTGFGAVFFAATWRTAISRRISVARAGKLRVFLFVLLSASYFGTPVLLMDGPLGANNHSLQTLQRAHGRVGKYVEIDRGTYLPGQGKLVTHTGDTLLVTGLSRTSTASLSIRGIFVTNDQVRILQSHEHGPFRDTASFVGIILVTALWTLSLIKRWQPGTSMNAWPS